jgi:hypothetical protein
VTSAKRAREPSRFAFNAERDTTWVSRSASVERDAPSRAASSEISRAERVFVPSSSMSAVREATPGAPPWSAAYPASTRRRTSTTGTARRVATTISSPFPSFARSTAGNDAAGDAPTSGIFERSAPSFAAARVG